MQRENEEIDFIVRTNPRTKNEESVQLQEILDEHFNHEEKNECPICGDTEIQRKRIKKAPEMLIIQVPRSRVDATKINTKITCPTGKIK